MLSYLLHKSKATKKGEGTLVLKTFFGIFGSLIGSFYYDIIEHTEVNKMLIGGILVGVSAFSLCLVAS